MRLQTRYWSSNHMVRIADKIQRPQIPNAQVGWCGFIVGAAARALNLLVCNRFFICTGLNWATTALSFHHTPPSTPSQGTVHSAQPVPIKCQHFMQLTFQQFHMSSLAASCLALILSSTVFKTTTGPGYPARGMQAGGLLGPQTAKAPATKNDAISRYLNDFSQINSDPLLNTL